MNKKIIIIGAGVAGLSAGCYALMNGYEAELFEMHSISGGLCTAWARKGYTFDGCIHFLMGTNPNGWLYRFWKEVGAFDGIDIINHEIYMQMEGPSGQPLILYSDPGKLREHLLAISPEDSSLIDELADAIRSFSLAGSGSRLTAVGMQKFAEEFRSPFLRESLSAFKDAQFFLSTMSAYGKKDAGWPVGGSLALIRGIEKRFLKLGGKIHHSEKVDEVAVEGGRAVGIKLKDGSLIRADTVLSAADGHATIYGLLGGKYTGEEIDFLYTRGKAYPSSIQVSLGIDCDLSGEPEYLSMKLKSPIEVAGEKKSKILIKNYCFDRTMSPAGKSVVTTLLSSSYDFWEKLSGDSKAYKAEKAKVASAVSQVLEERFLQTKGKIEAIDVATPLTYSRYTDAWRGAYMGWMSTPEMPIANIPSTLPGLKGFYMACQWTYPRGGLPTALMTARGAIMKICAEDGKAFMERLD